MPIRDNAIITGEICGNNAAKYPEKPTATIAAEISATKIIRHPTIKDISLHTHNCIPANTQLLLIGARKKDVEEELGIDIDEEKETLNSSDLYKELKVNKNQIPMKSLLKGKFPYKKELDASAADIKELSEDEIPGRKGGKIGGNVASTKAVSAAAITKLLTGIDLPKSKEGLVEYAEKIKSKARKQEQTLDPKEVIDAIKELPSDRSYYTMADVTKALGEIR